MVRFLTNPVVSVRLPRTFPVLTMTKKEVAQKDKKRRASNDDSSR